MSPPEPASTTLLRPRHPPRETRLGDGISYYCESRLLCFNTDTAAYTSRPFGTILSTADPVSVVFRPTRRTPAQVVCERIPHDAPLSWFGAPCVLVRVRIGLPVVGNPTPRPFSLLALLPLRRVRDTPPFLRLGTGFLVAHRATVRLTSSPARGELVIPYP